MDKNKKIINGLLILAAIQIVLLIVVNLFSFNSIKARKADKMLLKNASAKNITKVKIWDKIDGFTLTKEKDAWYVSVEEDGKNQLLPGDQKKILDYIEILASLNEGTVIYRGSDTSSDSAYGFTETNTRNVEVYVGDKKPQALQLGSNGNIKKSTYLRFAGDSKIRMVNSDIAQKTDRIYKDWTRREILPGVAFNDIEAVKFSGDCEFLKDEYSVKKQISETDKKEAYVIDPAVSGEIDQSAVGIMLGKIVNLKADNFKFTGTVEGKEVVAQVEILCKGGKSHTVTFYRATDDNDVGDFIAATTIDNYLYLFHDDTLTGAFKNSSDLVKKN